MWQINKHGLDVLEQLDLAFHSRIFALLFCAPPRNITMVTISIQGLHDGVHPIDMSVPVGDIDGLGDEFRGDVHISGDITRNGKRMHLDVDVAAVAHLICDRSLEEYDEPIQCELSLDVVVDNELAIKQASSPERMEDIIGVRDDQKVLLISEDIRQELMLALPMRKVAPQWRDRDLSELYPSAHESSSDRDANNVVDDRWAALRSLKKP
jgi:uncharacterized metal-binding protein YceD (DUF177 family)